MKVLGFRVYREFSLKGLYRGAGFFLANFVGAPSSVLEGFLEGPTRILLRVP